MQRQQVQLQIEFNHVINNTSAPKKVKAKGEVSYTRIAYITKDELDGTEKYLKGHLTLEKMNKAIDEIHQILETKYKLLAVPVMKLNGEHLKKYRVRKLLAFHTYPERHLKIKRQRKHEASISSQTMN